LPHRIIAASHYCGIALLPHRIIAASHYCGIALLL